VREHEADGSLPTSGRFLFYELVQRRVLSKEKTGTRRPDQDLIRALTHLRQVGLIPWTWIVDETRSLERFTGWSSIAAAASAVAEHARLDPWRGDVPLVLTESR
jgi:hypothetical protein